MILSQQQIDSFYVKGYVLGGKVLEDEEVERLRGEMHKVLEGRSERKPVLNRNLNAEESEYGDAGESKKVVHQIVNIWESSDAFLEHARNPRITEAVARLCNNTEILRIWHDQIQYKPPRVGGQTGWHQDHPAWPVIIPADLVSAWVALDDVDLENGCMWMVPGSHHWGRIPIGYDADFRPKVDPILLPEGVEIKVEPLVMKKGEVAFHHSMTWHGSDFNYSDRHRRAIAVHYMPGYTVYKPVGGHVMEQHIHVAPGEVLQGDHFPVVYERVPQMA